MTDLVKQLTFHLAEHKMGFTLSLFRWKLAFSFAFLILGVLITSSPSRAAKVETKATVGSWSIVCVKTASRLKLSDCSVATAAINESDPLARVYVALAFLSSSDDVEMTIRVPRVNYFGHGIIIALDGRQVGRGHIDRCDDNAFCESHIKLDALTYRLLLKSKFASFQYQISDTTGLSIAVNLDQLDQALSELADTLGIARARSSATVMDRGPATVELRSRSAGLTNRCRAVPATTYVRAPTGLRIDDKNFDEWLLKAKPCAKDAVFLITGSEAALRQAVAVRVKEKIPSAKCALRVDHNSTPINEMRARW